MDGPEVRILGPGSGLEVPASSGLKVRVLARDAESRMGGVSFLADVDGDGAISSSERIEATEVSLDVWEADITGLSGPAGFRGVRVLAEDIAGNYTLEDLDFDVVPDAGNEPPLAADGFVTTQQDTPVALSLSAADPNGGPLSFAIVTPPANGALSGTPPQLVYTPTASFSGFDHFTFRANDGLADSNAATWTVMVGDVNGPPVLTAPPAISLDEGETTTLGISASDPDGDALSLAVEGLPAFASFSDKGGGSGSLILAPGRADVGFHTFDVTASDGLFTSRAVVSVTVRRVDAPPVLAPIGNLTCLEEFTCTFYIRAWDADEEALVFSASGLPAFATFVNLGSGKARLTLEPQYTVDAGDYPDVTVNVSDGELTASETLSIHVEGDSGAPTLQRVIPPDGSTFLRDLREIEVTFDEPLDPDTVSADTFHLTANGTPVTALAIERRVFDSRVVLTFEPLAPASYELTIDAPAVTDRSGNPLGDAPLAASRFTLVDRAGSSSSLFPTEFTRARPTTCSLRAISTRTETWIS